LRAIHRSINAEQNPDEERNRLKQTGENAGQEQSWYRLFGDDPIQDQRQRNDDANRPRRSDDPEGERSRIPAFEHRRDQNGPHGAPALSTMGIDPIHFSIIFTHNMEIGLVHPPVGLNLFVLSAVAVAPIGAAIRGILPFLAILLIVLAVITYAPVLRLWLPDAVFGS
jgi:hypothetical protein